MRNSMMRYPLGVLVGMLLVMVSVQANACDPSLQVTLGGNDVNWNIYGCDYSVDATVTGGTAWNWKYYYYPPYDVVDECNWKTNGNQACGGPPPSEPWKFPAVGEYTVYVWVEEVDPDTEEVVDWAWDHHKVHVVSVGLSVASTDVVVNDDDDNENGCMDLKEPTDPNDPNSTVLNEDDLVQLTLSLDALAAARPDCNVRLGVEGGYPWIRIWTDDTRGTCLIDNGGSYDWPAPGLPDSWNVWIEGNTATGDCQVKVQYVDPWDHACPYANCGIPHADLMVVQVDMDMDGVADDQSGGGSALTEETTPGGFIPLGGLKALTVKRVMPHLDEPCWHDVQLSVQYSGTGRIEIWDDQTKTVAHDWQPFTPASEGTTFYVEGTHVSSDPCDITLVLTHNATGFQDKINLTVYSAQVTAVGFIGDHVITKWPSGPDIDPNNDSNTPVWGPGVSDPVCYTKNTPVSMFAILTVDPNIERTITGVSIRAKDSNSVVGSASGGIIAGARVEDTGNNDGDVDGIGGGSAVPDSNAVKMLTRSFTWEISLDGTNWYPAGTSGPHVMYWTDSTPAASPLYDFGLEKACGYVDGDADIGGRINTGVATDIYYDPGVLPCIHDLGIYTRGYGQCCCHVCLFSLLVSHVRLSTPPSIYAWGGCSSTHICRYEEDGEIFPSFQCNRPSYEGALYHPHFLFHVQSVHYTVIYDPSYGLTQWPSFLCFAPAVPFVHYTAGSERFGSGTTGLIQHMVPYPCECP